MLPATSRNRPATKAIRSQVGNLIGFMRRARAVHQAADDPISRPWRGSFDIKPTGASEAPLRSSGTTGE
ncbi:hypothetical protein ACH79_18320 [Bradyrhizobium sp. CCBAU 051011]|uniref:hypothetical protein n=1 Tax=Bradyrhizobium sp. CCBAU 051011 TaxID=858422 RepID=UPI001373B834|nr:hypothetical protein [Bradyrhizobium sp. CCBAU 051011]QHO74297.1 hypothetical protein ACH79_18320 [Bradyrhizobium sp. CCBAU 051011]